MMTIKEAIRILELYNPFLGGDDKKLFSEAIDVAIEALNNQFANPDKKVSAEGQEGDPISRQAAIAVADFSDYVGLSVDDVKKVTDEVVKGLKQLPSAQPERLTDDDFETIRIHLNAYKEKLCNQRRWEEAEEYQRIIDRFMAFASAQPEKRTETHACDCISRQAAIDVGRDLIIPVDGYHMYNQAINNYCAELINLPAAQPETCEGCKHLGKWENEVEYGYPSPCTRCKRRVEDHYER